MLLGLTFKKENYRREINRIFSSLSRSVFTMSSLAGNQPKVSVSFTWNRSSIPIFRETCLSYKSS